ncbi:transposase [Bradyrhizobium sp. F1.13.1]
MARTDTKDHSTGGRQRLGGITKAGDSVLRSTLIVGPTALLRHIRKGRHKPTPWLASLLERKPPKLVAVALANKFARIALALDDIGRRVQPAGSSHADLI